MAEESGARETIRLPFKVRGHAATPTAESGNN
jgi:hypothetical protein